MNLSTVPSCLAFPKAKVNTEALVILRQAEAVNVSAFVQFCECQVKQQFSVELDYTSEVCAECMFDRIFNRVVARPTICKKSTLRSKSPWRAYTKPTPALENLRISDVRTRAVSIGLLDQVAPEFKDKVAVCVS